MSLESKVYGAPLQGLYRQLQTLDGAPRQPEVLRELSQLLEREGLQYHSRTLKRQLLGDIEYVPVTLEKIFLEWMEQKLPKLAPSLKSEFHQAKNSLDQSQDQGLYVPPEFFIEMADAYLFLHKGVSRRSLALQLKASLAQKNLPFGLETLQAALAGKTLKIRKVLEDELSSFLSREGFNDKVAVAQLIEGSKKEGSAEVKKVDVGNLPEQVDAYLMNRPGLSRRQLAIHLQQNLAEKGYHYHLSSLQSTLEGKTHKTRKAVLETLLAIFAEDSKEAWRPEENQVTAPEQREWHHYVDAKELPQLLKNLMEKYPTTTRRQIALLLQEDLRKRNFKFSLNTLQYILGAKTLRVKRVVLNLLEDYLAAPDFGSRIQDSHSRSSSGNGRLNLEKRLELALQKLKSSAEQERSYYLRVFLDTRAELIKKRWQKAHPTQVKKGRKAGTVSSSYENYVPDESVSGSFLDPNDIPVAYDIEASSDRLVS